MPNPLVAIGGGSLLGAGMQASAAKKGAKAQTEAAGLQYDLGLEQLAENRRQYDTTLKNLTSTQKQQDARYDRAFGKQRGLLNRSAEAQTSLTRNAFADQEDELWDGFRASRSVLNQSRKAQNEDLWDGYKDQRKQIRTEQARFNVYTDAGKDATNAMLYELGLGAAPTGYGGLKESEAYKWRVDQGNKALAASNAAQGDMFSGRAMQAAQDYGQGLATQEYDNHYDRLSGLSSQGLAATNSKAQLGSQLAGYRGDLATGLASIQDSYGTNVANMRSGLSSNLATAQANLGANLTNIEANRSGSIGNAFANWASQGANSLGNTSAGIANAGNNFLTGMANANGVMGKALGDIGNAKSAGAVGAANAWGSGFENILGAWQFNQMIKNGGLGGAGGLGG